MPSARLLSEGVGGAEAAGGPGEARLARAMSSTSLAEPLGGEAHSIAGSVHSLSASLPDPIGRPPPPSNASGVSSLQDAEIRSSSWSCRSLSIGAHWRCPSQILTIHPSDGGSSCRSLAPEPRTAVAAPARADVSGASSRGSVASIDEGHPMAALDSATSSRGSVASIDDEELPALVTNSDEESDEAAGEESDEEVEDELADDVQAGAQLRPGMDCVGGGATCDKLGPQQRRR